MCKELKYLEIFRICFLFSGNNCCQVCISRNGIYPKYIFQVAGGFSGKLLDSLLFTDICVIFMVIWQILETRIVSLCPFVLSLQIICCNKSYCVCSQMSSTQGFLKALQSLFQPYLIGGEIWIYNTYLLYVLHISLLLLEVF